MGDIVYWEEFKEPKRVPNPFNHKKTIDIPGEWRTRHPLLKAAWFTISPNRLLSTIGRSIDPKNIDVSLNLLFKTGNRFEFICDGATKNAIEHLEQRAKEYLDAGGLGKDSNKGE